MNNLIDFDSFENVITDFARNLKKSLEKLSGSFDFYKTFNKELGEIISASFEKLPDSVKIFSKSGWYLTKEMTFSEIHNMASLVQEDKISEVDSFMTQHIQENRDRIFRRLLDRFAERKVILSSAIQAHERKDYFASIPIFLSQSDGLCYQITGYKLYTSENKKPKVAKYHEQIEEGTFDHVLLQPLTISSSLVAHSETEGYKGYLNRHEVLHGLSLDYGTEVNSCKSISILNFVGEILYNSNFEKKKKDKNSGLET